MKGKQSKRLEKNGVEMNGNDEKVTEVECTEKPMSIKLVAIEKLMDPKLLDKKPSGTQSGASTQKNQRIDSIAPIIREKRTLSRAAKNKCVSTIYIDSESEKSSSSDEPLIVQPPKQYSRSSRSHKNTNNTAKATLANEKSVSAASSRTTSLTRSTAKLTEAQLKKLVKENCSSCQVKVQKLPKSLKTFMITNGLSEIRNLKNEVIRVGTGNITNEGSSGSRSRKEVSVNNIQ